MEFEELQKILSQEIQKTRQENSDSLTQKHEKLQISDAFFCGEDVIKNRKFFEASRLAITDMKNMSPNEEIHVLDAGSGTGILGILALLAGADSVTFIEANQHTLNWSKNFIKKLGLSESCTFYCDDATKVQLSQKYHVLVSETITIDFQREDFHKIITHLKQFLVPKALIIPQSFEITFIQKDPSENIISKNSIYRKSSGDFSAHREVFLEETETLDISGSVNLYKNVFLKSGDCVSFLNMMTFEREELGREFVWGK